MAAERLVREGLSRTCRGRAGPSEVGGILGHAGDNAQVVSCAADGRAAAQRAR